MLKQNYSLIPTNFLLNRIYSISLYIQNFRFLYMYLHDCFLQTFKVRIIGNNDYNTKRAFESVNLSRTLVFLFPHICMYKNRRWNLISKTSFQESFPQSKEREKQKRSFIKREQRLTSVFVWVIFLRSLLKVYQHYHLHII